MLKRLLLAALAVALFSSTANAQSACAAMTRFGQVLTLAQWQSCWQAKADVGSGGGGSITGAQVVAALTYTPANKAGDTFTGEIVTKASASGGAGFNLPHGAAPSSPQNGDVWTTTAGLFVRVNGTTIGPITTPGAGFAQLSATQTFTGVNTFASVVVARRTVNSNTTLSATTDNLVCGDVSGGAITLTMPPGTGAAIANGLSFGIDDCKRQSATHTLTVAANTGQTICGAASAVITVNGSSVNPTWNSTDSDWNCF